MGETRGHKNFKWYLRTKTCCSVKSSTRDLWNSKLMNLWSLDLKPYANTCSINLVELRKDLRLYKFYTYKFSISLPENVHHFTNICFSTLQVVPDKGNITHTRKSYYFVLCKSNIIIAIWAGILWEHLRSFTSAFRMRDTGSFIYLPITTSTSYNIFFIIVYYLITWLHISIYLSEGGETMNNDKMLIIITLLIIMILLPAYLV